MYGCGMEKKDEKKTLEVSHGIELLERARAILEPCSAMMMLASTSSTSENSKNREKKGEELCVLAMLVWDI